MEMWIILAIISIILIIVIFLLVNFKWIIKEIRIIGGQPSGYFKMGQIIILGFTLSIFTILLVYNLKFGGKVSVLDLFLTITVGFMGTIIGLFYGGQATHYISQPRREAIYNLTNKSIRLANESEKLENRYKELEDKYLKIKKSK